MFSRNRRLVGTATVTLADPARILASLSGEVCFCTVHIYKRDGVDDLMRYCCAPPLRMLGARSELYAGKQQTPGDDLQNISSRFCAVHAQAMVY
jgi:hypothetical protein